MIKKVENIEEAIECNKLLTELINEEKEYNDNIKDDFIVSNYFENLYLDNDKVLFIDIEDEKIVGYIYVKINKLDDSNKNNLEAFIDGLYVIEGYRNRGIATNLINKVKEYCLDNKISVISLNVIYKNEIAKRLYEKLGFSYFSVNLKYNI